VTRIGDVRRFRLRRPAVALVALAVALVAAASGSASHGTLKAKAVAAPSYLPKGMVPAGNDWPTWGGDQAGTNYSPLAQINSKNVGQLKLAWAAPMANFPTNPWSEENGVIEVSGANNNLPLASGTLFQSLITGVEAINPTSGKVLWQYQGPPNNPALVASPGLGGSQCYTPREVAFGDGMVFAGQQDGSITAVNAKTGADIWTAQVAGAGTYGLASHAEACPYVIFGSYAGQDMVFSGVNGGDSPLRGHVDAYNARTGELLWTTFTTPDPTQMPYILSWGNPAEAATAGASEWSLPVIDQQTGLIYFGTGNAFPETGRAPGNDLWTDSIMAVSLKNGALKWYYQFVHHDEWDYDTSNPPTIFNANVGGKPTQVVAIGNKDGYLFVLNAANGGQVKNFSIPEVKVPDLNDGKGATLNQTSATEPEPTGAAGQITLHCATADIAKSWIPTWPNAPNGTPIIPTCPFASPYNDGYYMWFGGNGAGGGISWPKKSYDPQTNMLYVCSENEFVASENTSATTYQQTSITGGGIGSTPAGIPGGWLSAVNMNDNTMAWQVPYDGATDTDCYAGALSTAGGVVFEASRGKAATAGTQGPSAFPGTIYAYDAKSGKQLWSWQDKYGDQVAGPPATYMVGGKQYFVENVMAPPATGTREWLVAFSL
jgi:glucose dehydrogenase